MNIAIVNNSQTKFAKTAFSFLVSLVCTLAIMAMAIWMSNAAHDVVLVMSTFAIATALLIAVVIGGSSITVREAVQKTLIIFLVASITFGASHFIGMF